MPAAGETQSMPILRPCATLSSESPPTAPAAAAHSSSRQERPAMDGPADGQSTKSPSSNARLKDMHSQDSVSVKKTCPRNARPQLLSCAGRSGHLAGARDQSVVRAREETPIPASTGSRCKRSTAHIRDGIFCCWVSSNSFASDEGSRSSIRSDRGVATEIRGLWR